MTTIAPTAIVSPKAELADNVIVGPGAIIESGCRIGAGCEIGAYSILYGGTQLGEKNHISPFCSLGAYPQDKKFDGEETALIIGNGNTIREYCFFNRGTAANGETRIGDDNWIMAYVHLAHDCVIGNRVTIANGAQFAGHIEVADGAIIGGGVLMLQFRRVGEGAIIGGGERLRHDVPPYAWYAEGVVAANVEGMKRNGLAPHDVDVMKEAYRCLYRRNLSLEEAKIAVAALAEDKQGMLASALQALVEFLALPDLRLLRPRAR